MKKILLSVATVALGLVIASPVLAEHKGNGGHPTHQAGHNNHNNHRFDGHRFSHGYWFPRGYSNWSYYCWSPRYGCNFYWDTYSSCYYYYCAPQSCYYPISYITYAPPQATATAAATATVSQVVNVQNGVGGSAAPQVQGNAPPAPPAGAGPVRPFTPPAQ